MLRRCPFTFNVFIASFHAAIVCITFQGKFDEARSLFARALAIREKALGPDHRYVGQSLNNLANVWLTMVRADRNWMCVGACENEVSNNRVEHSLMRFSSLDQRIFYLV